MTFDYNRLYLTTSGRIGRADFWTGLGPIAAVMIVVALIAVLAYGPLSQAFQVIVFILELILAVPAYALFAKRFQDRGRRGVIAAIPIAVFIAIAFFRLYGWGGNLFQPTPLDLVLSTVSLAFGVWLLIDLGILRGTVGPNAFGPDPVAAR